MAEFNGSIGVYDNRMTLMGMGSSFDTKALMDMEIQMMELKNQPYLQRKKDYQSEKDVWTAFNREIETFKLSAENLKNLTRQDKNVTGAADVAAIQASAGAIEGSYQLTVTQLASRHKVLSDRIGNGTMPLGYDGDVTINDKSFTFKSDMSVGDVAIALNKGDYGVSAVVIDGALVVTSKKTGASERLSFSETNQGNKVTSSDPQKIKATIIGTPQNGTATYSLDVQALAQTQINTSAALGDSKNELTYTGTFTLDGVMFAVANSDSIEDIVKRINEKEGIGVTASLNKDNQLVFTSNETGTDAAFTLEDHTSNGSDSLFVSIGMVDENGNFLQETERAQNARYTVDGTVYESSTNQDKTVIEGVELSLKEVTNGNAITLTVEGGTVGILESMGLVNASKEIKHEVEAAKDSYFEIDGISMTRSSNKVSDAVSGVTIALLKTSSPVTFEISEDQETVETKVSEFVAGYNKLIKTLNLLTAKEGALQGEIIPTRLKTDLGNAITRKQDSGLYLYEIGIETDGVLRNGAITFDSSKLAEALSEKPDEVLALLSGDESIGQKIYDRIQEVTSASGAISSKLSSLVKQIADTDETLRKNEEAFEIRRQSLLKKYAMFEMMMNSLTFQSDYLEAQLNALNSEK
jgi:flagellar hook-associated protein 2